MNSAIKPKKMKPKKPASAKYLIPTFAKLYPEPQSELNFTTGYELLIAVVLSAQCTDKKVNEVTPKLFKLYPSFKKLSTAQLQSVEEIIRPINYYKTKAKNLIALSQRVESEFHGTVPLSRKELISLPGVGQKTANVVLGELEVEHTFPVDTHVFRVSKRLGLSQGKTVEAVEEDLKKVFEKKDWRTLHHCLIFHGRRVCKAVSPRCNECVLLEYCPSGKTFSP